MSKDNIKFGLDQEESSSFDGEKGEDRVSLEVAEAFSTKVDKAIIELCGLYGLDPSSIQGSDYRLIYEMSPDMKSKRIHLLKIVETKTIEIGQD